MDRRELRTLSHCFDYSDLILTTPIISSPNHLTIALNTLERNWKDAYLFGLINCYLKNWQSKHVESLTKLGEFIFGKLKQYDGNRNVLKSLKGNIKFFDPSNGDLILGSELALKNKQIKDATKYLGLPANWFSHLYFSRVIIGYYDKRKKDLNHFIDDLDFALIEHKNSITNKRLISKLIIQANTNDYAVLQDKIKSIAFRLVGDAGNSANWSPFNYATENEKEELRKARQILNEWITRQFINVFFEKCINDLRRKRFWLRYAKEIVQFRVVGSKYIKQLLLSDNRIGEFVSPRFSKTNSSRDSNAALMFIIRSHLFIEFSDEGAFYAYKLTNASAPSIECSNFHSVSDLKMPTMNFLAYRTGVYINRVHDEGRLGHNDGDLTWEEVAKYWIKEKVGINV